MFLTIWPWHEKLSANIKHKDTVCIQYDQHQTARNTSVCVHLSGEFLHYKLASVRADSGCSSKQTQTQNQQGQNYQLSTTRFRLCGLKYVSSQQLSFMLAHGELVKTGWSLEHQASGFNRSAVFDYCPVPWSLSGCEVMTWWTLLPTLLLLRLLCF